MNIYFRYSTLKLITDTNIERAVDSYFKSNSISTHAMSKGTKQHDLIENYYTQYGKFPEYIADFIAKTLNDEKQECILEKRIYIKLFKDDNNTVYLTFCPDCVLTSSNWILDWKTSMSEGSGTPMSAYLNSEQVDVYSLAYPEIDKGAYIKLNENKIKEYGVKSLGKKQKQKILEKYTKKSLMLYEAIKPIIQ